MRSLQKSEGRGVTGDSQQMPPRTRLSERDSRVTLYEPEPPAEPGPSKKRPSRVSASPPKKKIKLELSVPHPEPKRWRECLDVIEAQRKTIVAPVDTMGCQDAGKLEDDLERPDVDERVSMYLLLALNSSSQTKDQVTAQAVSNLRRDLPGGLTLDSVLTASESQIAECINKVGFWRRKAGYIKAAAQLLADGDGDVPKSIDGLLALPGVGPKMGFLALQSCWDLNHGIGVGAYFGRLFRLPVDGGTDTHVHRITNRLGWHKKQTKEPEETRLNLESWLPKELHRTINKTLVGFGQVICLPLGPRCDLCTVAQVPGLCPSKRKVTQRSPKAKKEEADALVKIEVPAAQIADHAVAGELLVKLETKDTIEVRHIKTEEGEIKDEVAISSLTW